MSFRISTMALTASFALLAGATAVHAQSTPATAPAEGTGMHPHMAGKPHAMGHHAGSKGASSQDPAVDRLNDQSLQAAQAGRPAMAGTRK